MTKLETVTDRSEINKLNVTDFDCIITDGVNVIGLYPSVEVATLSLMLMEFIDSNPSLHKQFALFLQKQIHHKK